MIDQIINGIVYVTVDNSTYSFPSNLQGLIDCDELLNKLSMKELIDLFLKYGGLPVNFDDYFIKKVKLYGDSPEVNSFICEGQDAWLTKEQRSSIMNLINLNKVLNNKDTFEVILHDKVHELPSDKIIDLISKLELYSYNCLVTTTKHVEEIKKVRSLPELIDYDYKTGYPDKIVLE